MKAGAQPLGGWQAAKVVIADELDRTLDLKASPFDTTAELEPPEKFATEVSFPSALARRLDPARMERSLRTRSRDAREVLGSYLQGVPVRWDFDVIRGSALAAVLKTAAENDLVVAALGAGSLVDDQRRREAALREVRSLRRALLLVDETDPRAPVLAVIAPNAWLRAVAPELRAHSRHCPGGLPVRALRPEAASGEGSTKDEDEQAASMLAALRIGARVQQRDGANAEALLEHTAAERLGLFVLCDSSPFFEAVCSGLAQRACSLPLHGPFGRAGEPG